MPDGVNPHAQQGDVWTVKCRQMWASPQGRRFRSLLDQLKKDQAQALQQHQFPATTCPICFDDIQGPNGNPESDEPGPSHSVEIGRGGEAGDPNGHAGRIPNNGAVGSSSSLSAPLLEGSDSRKDR